MELTHSFTVPGSVDDAWQTFMDLEVVGSCFPGATVTQVTDEGFSGTVKVKLGPIAMLYAGSGSFVERDDVARRAVIEAKGKDKRGNGTAGATVTIQLVPDGETATRADVRTDLSVTGKPAQFGRGVMQDVSDKLLQQFIDCIEGRLAPTPPTAEQPVEQPVEQRGGQPPTAPVPVSPVGGPAEVPRTGGPVTSEDAISLGGTVGPALLRAYGPQVAVGALLSVVVLWLLRRRRRR
jgi:uncharacterized protein